MLAGVIALLFAGTAAAELRVASVFGDHMVLQQSAEVAIWGESDADETITVKFAGQLKSARSTAEGKWRLSLDAMPATRDGGDLIVSAGGREIVFKDVCIGEVWLCAGQSNMAAPTREFDPDGALTKGINAPRIRMIRIPERPAEAPCSSFQAEWQVCSPDTAPNLSAFGYHYARKLSDDLDVPVGIVLCAWGGSSVAAWTSPEALDDPRLRALMPHDVIGWRENCRPSKLYLGMLHPLIPYTVKGVIWYQGETEGDPEQNSFAYRLLFPAMIQDWRRRWNRTDMPFYFVQMPRLINKPQWPVVREGQAAGLSQPHTGRIVTLDLGHERELHPKNKEDFAARMANLVLHKTYGRDTPADSPVIESIEGKGSAIIAHLSHSAGIETSDGQSPRCFKIAGTDGRFSAAQAVFEGETLRVSSGDVPTPVMLRYAYDDNPDVNVINAHGLPLAPYRSDSLPVPTSELTPIQLASEPKLHETFTAVSITDVTKILHRINFDEHRALRFLNGSALHSCHNDCHRGIKNASSCYRRHGTYRRTSHSDAGERRDRCRGHLARRKPDASGRSVGPDFDCPRQLSARSNAMDARTSTPLKGWRYAHRHSRHRLGGNLFVSQGTMRACDQLRVNLDAWHSQTSAVC